MSKYKLNLIKIFIFSFLLLFNFLDPIKLSAQSNNSSIYKSDIVLNNKDESVRYSSIASIQILNKTTAKNSAIDLKIGQQTKVGTITIIARKCWQAPIEQKPETKILIEVLEDKSLDKSESKLNRIFYGWLFASSPSISGLEHPIYDIVAISCKK